MTDTFIDNKFKRHLKGLGTKAIEGAIIKAIFDLTGVEYDADIFMIKFAYASSATKSAANDDIAELKMTLKKTHKMFMPMPDMYELK
jgi:hypothetical protein